MGIIERIKNAILGSSDAPPSAVKTAKPIKAPATATPGAISPALPVEADKPSVTGVDVGSILDAAVKKKRQKLKWRTSIIDLMKALDLDSSLANRKALAKELGYSGDTKNFAAMNRWLHSQVMEKLVANGGVVPPDLH